MNINTDIQLYNKKLVHFLNIEGLDQEHILEIINKADLFFSSREEKVL